VGSLGSLVPLLAEARQGFIYRGISYTTRDKERKRRDPKGECGIVHCVAMFHSLFNIDGRLDKEKKKGKYKSIPIVLCTVIERALRGRKVLIPRLAPLLALVFPKSGSVWFRVYFPEPRTGLSVRFSYFPEP